jgi:hypothetical protein
MFRVVLSPIISSAYNCFYSIWYLSHRYCYLPLSWRSWNRSECAVGGECHISFTWKFHIENPKRCNSVSTFYFLFIWSSTCFVQHTAHYQEPETALAASGFAYVEGCWTCSCWTLTASNKHPLMQNQKLLVQFQAPDNGQCVARNM